MKPDREGRTKVLVRPRVALAARPRLLGTLEAAFPVAFVADDHGGDAEAVIEIREQRVPSTGPARASAGRPTLVLGGSARPGAPTSEVALGEGEPVDRRLRGITLLDPLDGPSPAPLGDSETVLATGPAGPAWTRTPGPAPIDCVGSSLPELGPAQALRDLLGERPLALIALVQLLRAATRKNAFSEPALRATILFDDPNLRWRSYGFIRYRQLLDHADAHGYHAAMAMIPLDGWRQHRATVDLFRRRPDRLSLVLHGNDHLALELMRPSDDAAATAIAAQALRRAARFESRYNLRMDRVMTPPHGMCSAASARALAALRFDALCAIHPLPWRERVPAWRPLAGWDAAEFAAGCAVIPRLPLDSPPGEIALRAFLGQPLVLYGHHDDLAGGLDPLAETAARVNRLGDVRWASLAEIAATNHATRLAGGVLRVRPYSHRLRVSVPAGAGRVAVDPPRGTEQGHGGWTSDHSPTAGFGVPVPCEPGELEVRLAPLSARDPAGVPAPGPRVWPVLRRAATETRDRLRPLLPAGSA
jgi:hypothetical protein